MHDDTTPASWGKAFAALSQETPPAQAWERVSARLDHRHRNRNRSRAPAWIALATAAALVLSLTLLERRQPVPAEPSHARLTQAPTTPKPTTARLYKTPVGATEVAITNPDAGATEVAKSKSPAIAASAAPTRAPTTDKPSSARLYSLYAESAQLEALLTVARDDRVSSASAALLADELETQVAVIDASLSQPGLGGGERVRLWQARVDALRQAAGFESTQRLLASQGRSDVMLVSVD